jgi:hypothetical protein
MRLPATKWQLQGMLLLIMLSGALPVHAQRLDVCNKGTVTVEVVVAIRKDIFLPGTGYWDITGIPVAAGGCERVYERAVPGGTGGEDAAYIGFGFADSQGQWGAGTVDRNQVPDMGTFPFRSPGWGRPKLSPGEKTLCVRRDKTAHRIRQDPLPQLNCATLQIPPNDDAYGGRGPYVPLTTALYFQPSAWVYNEGLIYNKWQGGDYYLNIAPSATSRDLHASLGSADGATQAPSASLCGAISCWAQIANALKNYDPEKAAAEARARAEA